MPTPLPLLFVLAALLLLATACGTAETADSGARSNSLVTVPPVDPATPEPLPTAELEELPTATPTPLPTPSPEPTATPEPSATPEATAIAEAGSEQGSPSESEPSEQPTETAAPDPDPTPTPATEPTEPTASADATDAADVDATAGSEALTGTPDPSADTCAFFPGHAGPDGFAPVEASVVVEGLRIPWGLAFLPNGDMLVTERNVGEVRLVRDGELLFDPVLTVEVTRLPPPPNSVGSEGGLLGILLHPEFSTNRTFWLYYNLATPEAPVVGRIEQFVLSANGTSATPDGILVDNLPTGLHHQGGRMHIGPDGMLYVGVGADDPWLAQDPNSLAGKLLRMQLDGGIPADNPDPDSYVYLSGIRNTQGYDWINDTHLILNDHGPSGKDLGIDGLSGLDEVNVVTAGDNLGWPETWGCDSPEGLTSPVLVFEKPVPPTGAIWYEGTHIPEWTNSFLFTTVGFGGSRTGRHLHRVVVDTEPPFAFQSHEVYFFEDFGRLRTVEVDADGVIHFMTSNCDNRGECPSSGDQIYRIDPVKQN